MSVKICQIDPWSGDRLSDVAHGMSSDVGNNVCEGPHIFKKDGTYYLITANGGTETAHQEWIYRAAHPLGPWNSPSKEDVNPIVYNALHREIQQTGHMDMVEGKDGQLWAVFLGVRPRWKDGQQEAGLSQLGRETFLAPVQWENGWPIVNNRQPISLNMSIPLKTSTRSAERYVETWGFSPDTSTLCPLSLDLDIPHKAIILLMRGRLKQRRVVHPSNASQASTLTQQTPRLASYQRRSIRFKSRRISQHVPSETDSFRRNIHRDLKKRIPKEVIVPASRFGGQNGQMPH